jgi:hypothetical protein
MGRKSARELNQRRNERQDPQSRYYKHGRKWTEKVNKSRLAVGLPPKPELTVDDIRLERDRRQRYTRHKHKMERMISAAQRVVPLAQAANTPGQHKRFLRRVQWEFNTTKQYAANADRALEDSELRLYGPRATSKGSEGRRAYLHTDSVARFVNTGIRQIFEDGNGGQDLHLPQLNNIA